MSPRIYVVYHVVVISLLVLRNISEILKYAESNRAGKQFKYISLYAVLIGDTEISKIPILYYLV